MLIWFSLDLILDSKQGKIKMDEIVLITFCNRQTVVNPAWEVYGHTAIGKNELLMTFPLKEQAILYAHTFYRIPVLQGNHASYIKVLRALCP